MKKRPEDVLFTSTPEEFGEAALQGARRDTGVCTGCGRGIDMHISPCCCTRCLAPRPSSDDPVTCSTCMRKLIKSIDEKLSSKGT